MMKLMNCFVCQGNIVLQRSIATNRGDCIETAWNSMVFVLNKSIITNIFQTDKKVSYAT